MDYSKMDRQALTEALRDLQERYDGFQQQLQSLPPEQADEKLVVEKGANPDSALTLTKLLAAVNNVQASIVITDYDGAIEFANPFFSENTGYLPEEYIGVTPRVLKSGQHSAEYYQNLWETIKSGKTWVGEFCNRRKNGEFYWESAVISPIRNGNHTITHFVAVKTDISEAKRVQQELWAAKQAAEEVQARFKALYDASFGGIAICRQGRFINFNRGLLSLTGYTDQEISQMALIDLFDDQSKDLLSNFFNSGQNGTVEASGIRRDGSGYPVKIELQSIPFNGEMALMLELRDITREKLAEERLRESEERFRLLTQVTIEGIVIHEGGIIQDFNPSLLKILGCDADRLRSVSVMNFVHPDDWDNVRNNMEGLHTRPYEIKLLKSDGTALPVEIEAGNYSFNGSKQRVLAIRDITKRKTAEQKFKILFDQSPVGLGMEDYKTERFLEVNDALVRITGYQREELLQKRYRDLIPENFHYQIDNQIRELNEKGWFGPIDKEYIHKDGSHIPVRVSGVLFKTSDHQELVWGIIEDNTLRKQHEQTIELQNKNLKELNLQKDRFISILGHDLKSPFSGLLGIAELLAQNSQRYDREKIAFFANHIYKAVKNTYDLLDDLLMWARMQSGRFSFNPSRWKVTEILEQIQALKGTSAAIKDIRLEVHASPDLWLTGDREMIMVVLRNLVSNGIKFTNPGGTITMEAHPVASGVELKVTDTGIGIRAEKLELLFDDLFTESENGTEGEAGTGIGLSLCKSMVEMHGGRITVESEVGKGSVFTVFIPV